MKYRQLNAEERSALAALRSLGLNKAEIARDLGRHRSTVGRELKRNSAPYDGGYRSARAHQRAHARRYRSRRNSQFEGAQWERVEELLREEWSPEQVSGLLERTRELAIRQETIYRHVWRDLKAGGTLHLHLRCARKQCRKRYGRYERPRAAGWEADDRRAACGGGEAKPCRALGDRHDDGRKARGEQRLHSHPGRAQDRLRHDRQAGRPNRGRSQPRLAGTPWRGIPVAS